MVIYSGTKDFKLNNTVVALGKFDGLHLGHQILLDKLGEYRKKGYQTVVFTFDFHPMALLTGKKQSLIYTKEERYQILERYDIDVLIEFPFTMETAHIEACDFVENVLVGDIGAKVIVVGDDFHFGYQRAGDVALLKSLEKRYGYVVDNCEKLCIGDEEISATMIRGFISEGDMAMTAQLLGRPYVITGTVIRGKANGRKVGMPTANIAPSDVKLLPPEGVYATMTSVEGVMYRSLTNVGKNPTVGEHNELRVETYLLDFSGDLYDREIKVYFYKYIRGEKKFDSLETLRRQVSEDQTQVVKFFEEQGI